LNPPAPGLRPLPEDQLSLGALPAARALLGAWLVAQTPSGPLGGPIVEVKAYLPRLDPGSHSHRGPTPRNRSMFGPPGRAYVYRIYGLHHCFNVVAGPIGSGEAVLLRGLELRLAAGRQIGAEVAPGPGRLAALFGLDLAHDGLPLLDGGGPLALWRDPALPLSRAGIAQGRRIGLGAGRGQELALRLAQVAARRCPDLGPSSGECWERLKRRRNPAAVSRSAASAPIG
jgi:DNA-3-methyladenine glycosylase